VLALLGLNPAGEDDVLLSLFLHERRGGVGLIQLNRSKEHQILAAPDRAQTRHVHAEDAREPGDRDHPVGDAVLKIVPFA
jgi:hypothetical protein